MGWLYRAADAARRRYRARHWTPEQAAGRLGEDLAHRFLRQRRYRVVARNYRPPAGSGEIDLVAWDGAQLVFIEVKPRATDEYGAPDRAVDAQKQQDLERAARDYARRAGVEWDKVRFDTVSVLLGKPPSVTLRKAAFRSRISGLNSAPQ